MVATDLIQRLITERGLHAHLGIQVRIEDGRVVCRLPIAQTMLGAPGVAHGGAVMALLDTTLGAQSLLHAIEAGRMTSTVEMKVNFLRPARADHVIRAEARVDHAGKTLMVMSGTAYDDASGEAVAMAVGTFNRFPIPADALARWR